MKLTRDLSLMEIPGLWLPVWASTSAPATSWNSLSNHSHKSFTTVLVAFRVHLWYLVISSHWLPALSRYQMIQRCSSWLRLPYQIMKTIFVNVERRIRTVPCFHSLFSASNFRIKYPGLHLLGQLLLSVHRRGLFKGLLIRLKWKTAKALYHFGDFSSCHRRAITGWGLISSNLMEPWARVALSTQITHGGW